MHTERPELTIETLQGPNLVSARFLSDLFCTCELQGFSAPTLAGDLPISLGEGGDVIAAVEWNVFCDFMRRLGHQVGGARGLEHCGETLGQLAPARVLNSLAGIAASSISLPWPESRRRICWGGAGVPAAAAKNTRRSK